MSLLLLTERNGATSSVKKEGKANFAFGTGDEAYMEAEDGDMFNLSRISTGDLAATVERLAADPALQNLASRDPRTLDAIQNLRSLFNDQRFQRSYHFAQKVGFEKI